MTTLSDIETVSSDQPKEGEEKKVLPAHHTTFAGWDTEDHAALLAEIDRQYLEMWLPTLYLTIKSRPQLIEYSSMEWGDWSPKEAPKPKSETPTATRKLFGKAHMMDRDEVSLIVPPLSEEEKKKQEKKEWRYQVTRWQSVDFALTRATGELAAGLVWHDNGDPIDGAGGYPGRLGLELVIPADAFDRLAALGDNEEATLSINTVLYQNKVDAAFRRAHDRREYFIVRNGRATALFVGSSIRQKQAMADKSAFEAIVTKTASHYKEYTQIRYVMQEMGKATMAYATANNLDEDAFKTLWEEAREVADNLKSAVTAFRTDGEDEGLIWNFQRQPFPETKAAKEAPHLDRHAIESTADRYLKLPFRCAEFEHYLVVALVGVEAWAYADSSVRPMPSYGKFLGIPTKPLYRRPVWDWAKGQFWNTVALGGLATAVGAAGYMGWIGAGWAFGGCAVAVGLLALFFLLSIIAMPSYLRDVRRQKTKVLDLIDGIQTTYLAVSSGGPRSARHVQDRVDASAAIGVIWPAALFAVLDDIASKAGRF